MIAKKKSLFTIETNAMVDEKYTKVVNKPQYLPNQEKPPITALYDVEKYSKLIAEIESSDLPQDEKIFLKLAASRHIVFRYDKIADYYAHSNSDVQNLMEKSALVILDVGDAIANGYAKMSKNIEKLMQDTGRPTKD